MKIVGLQKEKDPPRALVANRGVLTIVGGLGEKQPAILARWRNDHPALGIG